MSCKKTVVILALGMTSAGCGMFGTSSEFERTPLRPQSFYDNSPPPAVVAEDRRQQADASGAIIKTRAIEEPRVRIAAPTTVSSVVKEVVATPPTTQALGAGPATGPSIGVTTAQYLTVGAIVVRVGDTPIYADK